MTDGDCGTHQGKKWVRVQLRTKESKGCKSVARPTKYGNPFSLSNYDLETSLELFEEYLEDKLDEEPTFLEPLKDVEKIGCFCSLEQDCHADIIIEKLRDLYEFPKLITKWSCPHCGTSKKVRFYEDNPPDIKCLNCGKIWLEGKDNTSNLVKELEHVDKQMGQLKSWLELDPTTGRRIVSESLDTTNCMTINSIVLSYDAEDILKRMEEKGDTDE